MYCTQTTIPQVPRVGAVAPNCRFYAEAVHPAYCEAYQRQAWYRSARISYACTRSHEQTLNHGQARIRARCTAGMISHWYHPMGGFGSPARADSLGLPLAIYTLEYGSNNKSNALGTLTTACFIKKGRWGGPATRFPHRESNPGLTGESRVS